MGLCALIGNGLVLLVRLRKGDFRTSKVQNQMIVSLAFADSLMGLYMIIITSADTYFGEEYYLSAPHWRESGLCLFAGILGFLSSEASVFTLTLITVDRLICIMLPFSRLKITSKTSAVIIAMIWLATTFLSIFALSISSVKPGVYGLSDVCLGLPLHAESSGTGSLVIEGAAYYEFSVEYVPSGTGTRTAWWLSVVVFIGLNSVSFTFILISYISMFIKTKLSSARLRSSASHKREVKIATRMAVIVITDFICWMPVIIMGILTQTGFKTLDVSVYAWTVILIVPINSSINPFIYTFVVLLEKRQKERSKSHTDSTNPVNVRTTKYVKGGEE